jgi:hypothetical protein
MKRGQWKRALSACRTSGIQLLEKASEKWQYRERMGSANPRRAFTPVVSSCI